MEVHKSRKRKKKIGHYDNSRWINSNRYIAEKPVNKSCQEGINGLFLQTKYIPEEILIKILCNLDHRSLLLCQLVCKYWRNLIQHFVWVKKAEETIKHKLLIVDKDISWTAYYFICAKLPFNKNLLKNHSGEEGPTAHWELPTLKNITWHRENPTVPVLPKDPLFSASENYCFVTSNVITWKYQIVDLIKEGFSPFLLDELRPKITISEWYCCLETPGLYLCDIEFLKDNGEKMLMINENIECNFQDHYTFTNIVKNTKQNKWLKFEHTFKNYDKGLRRIKFIHGGKSHRRLDGQVDVSEYGVKMARACIKIDLPLNDYTIKTMSKDV